MGYFWLLYSVLYCITATTTVGNVVLQTQQGIISGRQTQISIEYLGYDKIPQLNTFYYDYKVVFNMRRLFDGNHQLILLGKDFQMVH